jgi:hypothetical protein
LNYDLFSDLVRIGTMKDFFSGLSQTAGPFLLLEGQQTCGRIVILRFG